MAALLFVLLVTMPLAIALTASYAVALIAGAMTAVACLAAWLRHRFLPSRGEGAGMIALSVVIAALAYWLVALVPFVGVLIVLLAFTAGTGGLILLLARLYKQPIAV